MSVVPRMQKMHLWLGFTPDLTRELTVLLIPIAGGQEAHYRLPTMTPNFTLLQVNNTATISIHRQTIVRLYTYSAVQKPFYHNNKMLDGF